MKFLSLLTIAFVCVAGSAVAQDSTAQRMTDIPDSVFIVQDVLIKGNTRTKDFVILREMTLKPGTPITRALLEYDKNRIYSLGLFTQINITVIPSAPPDAMILVEVSERWFLFPYPIFGIKDRDWEKFYYGVGVLHNNFRGRNEKLALSLVFGFDPSVSLYYRNPFLNDAGTSFIEGRIAYNKVRSRSLRALSGLSDFDEKHFNVSMTIGKRFGIAHTLWLSAGYEIVDISGVVPVRTVSSGGIDRFPVLGAGYNYDTRDLKEYPGYGSFLSASVTKSGLPSDDIDVVRYGADYRRYIPLVSDFVVTARVFTNLAAAGKIPSYQLVFFGYGERIRGHFKEIMEGEQIFGLSSELHYPILEPRYFVVDFLPREFGIWKFGVYAALFADAGAVWFRGHPVSLNDFAKGYGAGLHFLLPYGSVLRLELGFNEAQRIEYLLDFGTTF